MKHRMIRVRELRRHGPGSVISMRARSDATECERAREQTAYSGIPKKFISSVLIDGLSDAVDPSEASLSIDRATIIATRAIFAAVNSSKPVRESVLPYSVATRIALSLLHSLSLSLLRADRYYSASERRCTPLSAAGCLHERLSTGNAYEAVLRVLLERIGD